MLIALGTQKLFSILFVYIIVNPFPSYTHTSPFSTKSFSASRTFSAPVIPCHEAFKFAPVSCWNINENQIAIILRGFAS